MLEGKEAVTVCARNSPTHILPEAGYLDNTVAGLIFLNTLSSIDCFLNYSSLNLKAII